MRSVGGDIKGVLMEIEQELYEEDQLTKQGLIDSEEQARLRPEGTVDKNGRNVDGIYGEIKKE